MSTFSRLRASCLALLAAALLWPLGAAAQVATGPVGIPASLGPIFVACGADATTQIQAALTAAGTSTTNNVVLLPPCSSTSPIIFSSQLNIPSNVTLTGYGRGRTWLKIADSSNLQPAIQNANAGGGASQVLDRNITISDLSIDANGSNQSNSALNRCIFTKGVANIILRHVEVKNCRSDAVSLNGNSAPDNDPSSPAIVDDLFINGTVGPSNGVGLWIQDRQRNANVSNVTVINPANHGVDIDASEGNYTNIVVKGAGWPESCGNGGASTVDNPSPSWISTAWTPCPAGIFFHNLTGVTVTNASATQGYYYGSLIVGTRFTTINNLVATQNSLHSSGVWDDLHFDYNNAIGYGEDTNITINGAVLGANGQAIQTGVNSLNPGTSRHGLFVNAGLAGSMGSATIVSGGSGYVVNDTPTSSGGTATSPIHFLVSSVSGGAITAMTGVTTNGNGLGAYTVLPTNPVSLTGGTGTGATINVQWTNATLNGINVGQTVSDQITVPSFNPNWVVQSNVAPSNPLLFESTATQTINTTSATSCMGSSGAGTGSRFVAAGQAHIGSHYHLRCSGNYTTPGASPGTGIFNVLWGADTIATVNLSTLPTSQSASPLDIDTDCVVLTTTTAKCITRVFLGNSALAGGGTVIGNQSVPTIHTATAGLMDITYTLSAGAVGTDFATMQQATIQVLN